MSERNLTCKTCRHYHLAEGDPYNVQRVRVGDCRERLHLVVIPTPNGMQVTALYPQGIPDNFPACGQYTPHRVFENSP